MEEIPLKIETQDAKVRNAIQILHAHKATETGNEYGTQRARKCFASEGSIAVCLCRCPRTHAVPNCQCAGIQKYR